MRSTDKAAVYPATPIAAVSNEVIASGTLTSQSAGKRFTSWYPPSWSAPIPKPCAITLSPGLKRGSADCVTSPQTSMPAVHGKRVTIFAFPSAVNASL